MLKRQVISMSVWGIQSNVGHLLAFQPSKCHTLDTLTSEALSSLSLGGLRKWATYTDTGNYLVG